MTRPIKTTLLKICLTLGTLSFLSNCATADLSSDTTQVFTNTAGSHHVHTIPQAHQANNSQNIGASNTYLNVAERRTIRFNEASWRTNTSVEIEPPKVDVDTWLDAVPGRRQHALNYQRYLATQIGINNLPPMSQLLVTARDWYKCGFEPYEVPPRYLWRNNVDTLKLYALLKQRGILPASTEIRSGYRNETLNRCAEGAATSRHVSNGAIDVWVPEYEDNLSKIHDLQDKLCLFRLAEGEDYNFGLGLYSKNAYHIDTYRVRMWGGRHTRPDSPCRIPIELKNTQ